MGSRHENNDKQQMSVEVENKQYKIRPYVNCLSREYFRRRRRCRLYPWA